MPKYVFIHNVNIKKSDPKTWALIRKIFTGFIAVMGLTMVRQLLCPHVQSSEPKAHKLSA